MGNVLFEPNLWHFNRHSTSVAALIGSICCFLPIPFQMLPCALMCVWLRCNLPLATAIVWVSNPITMPPMMYFAYRVGRALLGVEDMPISGDFSQEWFTRLATIWQPLLLGCLVCGLTLGLLAFSAVRLHYRWRKQPAYRNTKAPNWRAIRTSVWPRGPAGRPDRPGKCSRQG